jgi:hypothetical protein
MVNLAVKGASKCKKLKRIVMLDRTENDGRWSQSGLGGSGRDSGRAAADSADLERLFEGCLGG